MSTSPLRRLAAGLLLGFPLVVWLETSHAQVPDCSEVFPGPITEDASVTLNLPPFPEPNDGEAEWRNDQNLAAGTYYFQDLEIRNNVQVTLSGPVLIFVEGGVEIGNNVVINAPGDPADFVLISYDDIEIGNNSIVNGLVYASEDIELDNNVAISGAVTSEDEVETKPNTSVSYDPEAVDNADFGDLCSNGLPPAELEAEWRMDEEGWSGTTGEIVDSSGNGNDATARTAGSDGSRPDTVPGKVCNAGRFRGQGFNVEGPPFYVDAQHYADAPDAPSLSPLDDIGAMSLGGWFRLESSGGRLLHKGEGNRSQEYRVALNGNRLEFTLWDRWGGPRSMTVNPQALSTETWYFFAVTARRLGGSDDIVVRGYLYDESGQIGAVSEQTLTVDYTDKDTSGRLFLAAESFGGAPVNFLDGLLDEIRIYSGVLEPSEIDAFWANTRPCPDFTELLLEYRFEETGYDGSAGEVADSSGNGQDGTSSGGLDNALDDPAIAGNPGTCRYGGFDGNDDYVIDSDAAGYLEGLDAITVMAWVYNTASLADNNRGLFFTDDPGPGRDNRLGLRYDSEGLFGGGNNVIKASVFTDDCNPSAECFQVETVSGVMVTDQWQHIAMTWSRNDTIRVYVDGVEVGISGTEGSGGSGVLDEIDRLEIGQGAKGERWEGRIDEFRIFSGALDAAEINAERNRSFPCDLGYDHIRLTHPPSALTCSPATITVEACANADCSALYSGTAEVDFISPAQNWTPDPVSFTGSTSVNLQYTTPGLVTLDAVALNPATANPTRCFSGGGETDCEMEFLESGFLIEVPDHVADSAVTGTIAAVRADPADPQQCVPGFDNETREVDFWSAYVDPASGGLQVAIDGGAVPVGSPGTARSLTFDGNGEASFSLRYPDVGDVEVTARFEGSGDEAGLIMTGSDRFIARPAGFALEVPGNPAATTAGGDVFTTAGSDFEIEVAALNASGDVTPNFGRESTPEDVALENELVAPAGGAAPALDGSFGPFGAACDGSSATSGTACGNFSWPEVGIISITPRLASGAYLGTADVVGAELDHVGRFIPDRFELGTATLTDRAALSGCPSSSFTYIGERFDVDFTLYARNALGTTTQNYEGDFALLEAGDLGLSGSPPPQIDNASLDWVMGSGSAYAQLTLPRTTPEPPYPSYAVTTAPVDADGVALDGSGLVGTTALRFGRLVVDNAIGSELGPVELPWRVEYWDGATWRINADDDCTAIDLAAEIRLESSGGDTGDGTTTVSVGGGSTTIDASLSELTVSSGTGRFHFTAPGSDGWVNLTIDATDGWPFLADDLDADGSYEEDPTARASFGLFAGEGQRIFIQEIPPR